VDTGLVWFHTSRTAKAWRQTDDRSSETVNFAGHTIQIVDGNVDTAVRFASTSRRAAGRQSPGRGEARLIDYDEFVIREGRLGEIIEFGEISTEIHGGSFAIAQIVIAVLFSTSERPSSVPSPTSSVSCHSSQVVLVSCSQPTSSVLVVTRCAASWSGWHSGLAHSDNRRQCGAHSTTVARRGIVL